MPGVIGPLAERIKVLDMAGSPCVGCNVHKDLSNPHAEYESRHYTVENQEDCVKKRMGQA